MLFHFFYSLQKNVYVSPNFFCLILQGICESQTQDIIERFFDVFEDIDINVIGKSLRGMLIGQLNNMHI